MNMMSARTTINRLGAPLQIHRDWTPYEKGQLRNHLRTVGYVEMARRLNRTVSSVKWKAHELGLTKTEPEDHA